MCIHHNSVFCSCHNFCAYYVLQMCTHHNLGVCTHHNFCAYCVLCTANVLTPQFRVLYTSHFLCVLHYILRTANVYTSQFRVWYISKKLCVLRITYRKCVHATILCVVKTRNTRTAAVATYTATHCKNAHCVAV